MSFTNVQCENETRCRSDSHFRLIALLSNDMGILMKPLHAESEAEKY